VFCIVIVAEHVDDVGNKGSGVTTAVDLQTFFEAFLNMSLRSACFIDETLFFFWEKTNLPVLGLFS
jgi:hypothetical protein